MNILVNIMIAICILLLGMMLANIAEDVKRIADHYHEELKIEVRNLIKENKRMNDERSN